jgi:hypothetical protein
MPAIYAATYQGDEPAEGYRERPGAYALIGDVRTATGEPVARSARLRIGKKFARMGLAPGQRFQFQSAQARIAGGAAVFERPGAFRKL